MDKLPTLGLLAIFVTTICAANVVLPEFVDEQENDVTNILDEALKISKILGPGWAVKPLAPEDERDTEPEPEVAPEVLNPVIITYRHGWTKYDAPFSFKCPRTYEGISRIRSVHSNSKEDRQFKFNCRPIGKREPATCRWTDYMNKFDKKVEFFCGRNKYLAGMSSVHSNKHQDRIWKFFCCSHRSLHTGHCFDTYWTNDWDSSQDYELPPGYVMTGVQSYHDNKTGDRRFAYTICASQ